MFVRSSEALEWRPTELSLVAKDERVAFGAFAPTGIIGRDLPFWCA